MVKLKGELWVKYNNPSSIGCHICSEIKVWCGRWDSSSRGICLRKLGKYRTTCLSFRKVIKCGIFFWKIQTIMELRIFLSLWVGYSGYQLSNLWDLINNEITNTRCQSLILTKRLSPSLRSVISWYVIFNRNLTDRLR